MLNQQNNLDKGSIGFAANSSADWYDALKTLYNDHKLQTTQGNQGRKVVKEHYNAGNTTSSLDIDSGEIGTATHVKAERESKKRYRTLMALSYLFIVGA